MKRIELSISCHECVREGTPDCADCLVSFVIGEPPATYTADEDEGAVIHLLHSVGLVPALRYEALEEDETDH
jgi:hypothetical protein